MNIDDLSIGDRVRIITWDYRPDHWCEEGRMDDWRGAVVTIVDLARDIEEVYIDDDDGDWIWYPHDFEPYHQLPNSNPNIVYRRHKHNRMMHDLIANKKPKPHKIRGWK